MDFKKIESIFLQIAIFRTMKFLLPAGILLTLLGFSGGSWHLFSKESAALIPAGRYLYIPGIALLILYVAVAVLRGLIPLGAHASGNDQSSRPESTANNTGSLWPKAVAVALIFVLASDWPDSSFGFYPASWIRGEFILGAIAFFFISRFPVARWAPFVALSAIGLLIWSYFTTANGRLLFSDDHAMFLFRLHLLKENFPRIPFWSPLWNAGIDARDFFATGALSPFILGAPLVYFFDVTSSYNALVAYLLWVVMPLSSFIAVRLLSPCKGVAWLTAALSVTASMFWYRWTLKYGTMGFCVSTALAPLVAALGWRFITRDFISRRECVFAVLLLSLMLLWTPSGLAVIPPLAALGLPRTLSILRSKRKLLSVIAILIINVPILFTLWKISSVSTFLSSHNSQGVSHIQSQIAATPSSEQSSVPSPITAQPATQAKAYRHKSGTLNFGKALKGWQEFAIALNPLILLCAVPGILVLPRAQRLLSGVYATWLLLLGTIAVSLFPQLELDRMLVILSVMLCYPAANFIAKSFEIPSPAPQRCLTILPRVVLGAFLYMGCVSMCSVVSNRTSEQYSFASSNVSEVVEVAKKFSHGGRVLFTGCVLHQLSGGHLAPLAIWANTPMAASSYAHNIWSYVQLVPASFMARDDQGIEEFFDLQNSTVVFAHEPYWKTYCSSRPKQYQEVWKGDGFVAYKRLLYLPSYDVERHVTVTASTSNSITFTTTSPSAILKYTFFPFLTSTACSISSYHAAPELELVRVDNCPTGVPITIESMPPLTRIIGISP